MRAILALPLKESRKWNTRTSLGFASGASLAVWTMSATDAIMFEGSPECLSATESSRIISYHFFIPRGAAVWGCSVVAFWASASTDGSDLPC